MDVDSIHKTWEFSCLETNFLNQPQVLELEVLRDLVILCCKNVSTHKARKEQGEQIKSEEDLGLVVNMAKWLIPLD